jgi:hypothetical protein
MGVGTRSHQNDHFDRNTSKGKCLCLNPGESGEIPARSSDLGRRDVWRHWMTRNRMHPWEFNVNNEDALETLKEQKSNASVQIIWKPLLSRRPLWSLEVDLECPAVYGIGEKRWKFCKLQIHNKKKNWQIPSQDPGKPQAITWLYWHELGAPARIRSGPLVCADYENGKVCGQRLRKILLCGKQDLDA